MNERGRSLTDLRADGLATLVAFLRGYWHQDMREAHGTAVRAFEAFWADANNTERRAFLTDWDTVTTSIGRARWSEVRAAFERLGAAWTPPTRHSFARVDRAVTAKRTGSAVE